MHINEKFIPTKKQVILIFAILLFYCYAFQGLRGLWESDEGRYTAIPLRMMENQDWLHPHISHEKAHLSKPPLTYWAVAGSFMLFGQNEFAARFPSATGFFLSILAAFYIGKIFLKKIPWMAALIYATFIFTSSASNILTTDGLLTGWQSLGACAFVYAAWGKKEKSQMYLLLMWLFFSLAFFTKGPPGLISLLGIILFVYLSKKNTPSLNMAWQKGLIIFLVIGLSWYLFIIIENAKVAQYYFWDEFVLRIFSGHHKRNSQWYKPFAVYLPVLIFGTLPWTHFVIKGLIKTFKEAKHAITKKATPLSQSLFLSLWFFIPLTIFMLAKSRLPLYILPLFLPISIIAAREVENKNINWKWFWRKIAVWVAIILAMRIGLTFLPLKKNAKLFYHELRAVVHEPIQEIIFFGTPPIMGLHFYSQADVETIPFDEKIPGLAKETLKKGKRIWIIVDNTADILYPYAKKHNLSLKKLGDIAWEENYSIFEDYPADKAPSNP